jgi:hypothetical protein
VNATVTSPEGVEVALLHALLSLPGAGSAQAPVGRVWTIPARTVAFTGRQELLARLEAALGSGPTVVHAVHGMGGVVKTTLAIEYAHRHADEFDIAWWVAAEDPALVPDQLAGLARALGLAGTGDGAEVAPPACSEPSLSGSGGCWCSTTPRIPARWPGSCPTAPAGC